MKKFLLSVTTFLSTLITIHAQTVNYGRCDTFTLHQINLVAHYNFSSTTATGTIADLSGYGHTGTRVGLVTNASDAGGNPDCAIEFPGIANNHIKIASSTDFDFVKHPATLSLWYMPKETSTAKFEWLAGRALGSKHCASAGEYYMGIYDCRRPMAAMNSYNCFDMQITSPNCDIIAANYFNKWHHVVAVFDTGKISISKYPKALYVDGVCVNIWGIDSCGPFSKDTGDFFLGDDFKGLLDEVRIYNVAFTPSDVSTLYNYGIMGCCKPVHLPEVTNDVKIQVYPNPSYGLIQIDFPQRFIGGKFNIFNTVGQSVFHAKVLNNSEHLNLQHLAPGTYILDCSTELDHIHTRQLVTIL